MHTQSRALHGAASGGEGGTEGVERINRITCHGHRRGDDERAREREREGKQLPFRGTLSALVLPADTTWYDRWRQTSADAMQAMVCRLEGGRCKVVGNESRGGGRGRSFPYICRKGDAGNRAGLPARHLTVELVDRPTSTCNACTWHSQVHMMRCKKNPPDKKSITTVSFRFRPGACEPPPPWLECRCECLIASKKT